MTPNVVNTGLTTSARMTVKKIAVEVCIRPDEDGGYVGFVPRLPGTISQGDDEDKAFYNIKMALREAVESYRESGVPIPLLSHDEAQADGECAQSAWEELTLENA